MTGKERLRKILRHQKADRLSWTALVDSNTLNHLPENLRGNGGLDFYRYLGCDIFLLNGWGLPHELRSPEWKWPDFVRQEYRQDGSKTIRDWQTRGGVLTAIWDRGHPVKYPVDSRETIRAYYEMWEGMEFVWRDDSMEYKKIEEKIGDDGVMTRFWGPSAIPMLLENDMGVENFYYFLFDYHDEMDALIKLIHSKMLKAFECLANGPWESVTLCENTSTYYISPEIYGKYNMPHQRDFVELMKKNNKTAILHMCGHVRDILHLIKETGCDGIHALTPPPTGNTPSLRPPSTARTPAPPRTLWWARETWAMRGWTIRRSPTGGWIISSRAKATASSRKCPKSATSPWA